MGNGLRRIIPDGMKITDYENRSGYVALEGRSVRRDGLQGPRRTVGWSIGGRWDESSLVPPWAMWIAAQDRRPDPRRRRAMSKHPLAQYLRPVPMIYHDLFAGPGGWDCAAVELGWEGVGIELDASACLAPRAVQSRSAPEPGKACLLLLLASGWSRSTFVVPG